MDTLQIDTSPVRTSPPQSPAPLGEAPLEETHGLRIPDEFKLRALCPACGTVKTRVHARQFWKRHKSCGTYRTARALTRTFTCPSVRDDKVLQPRENKLRKCEIAKKKHGADWDVYMVLEEKQTFAVKESRRDVGAEAVGAIKRETNCFHAVHEKAPFALAVQLIGECKGQGSAHNSCLMVEWCAGDTLGTFLDRQQTKLNDTQKFLLVLRLAEFYKRLHQCRVEYRDGHSWNFMLAAPFDPTTEEDVPLVKGTDFSRARPPVKYEDCLRHEDYPFDRSDFNYLEFSDMFWFSR